MESLTDINNLNNNNSVKTNGENQVDFNNLEDFNTFNTQNENIQNKENNENDNQTQTQNDNVNLTENESSQFKEEIRRICLTVFCNFAKYSKEDNEYYLTYQNLLKILKTVNILDTNSKSYLKISDIDLLIKKVNPNAQRLSEKQYMNFIIQISSKLDPENFSQNKRLSTLKIVKTFFEPFSNYIEENNKQENNQNDEKNIFYHKQIQNNLFSLKIDMETIIVINSVYNGLYYIYQTYFYFEVNKFNEIDRIVKGSMESLLKFCKDFEICPFILTNDKIAIYYNLILDMNLEEIIISDDENKYILDSKRERGNIFTLSKFSLFLNLISLLHFDKNSKYINSDNKEINVKDQTNRNLYLVSPRMLKEENIDQTVKEMRMSEKLIFFFEKLENCQRGQKEVEKINHKTRNAKMSLIPGIEIINSIDSKVVNLLSSNNYKMSEKSLTQENLYKSVSNNNIISSVNLPQFKDNNNLNSNFFSDFRNFLSVKSDEVLDKFFENYETFKEIFETYAQIGDKFNYSHMSLSAFKRFLRDCNLIHQPSIQIKPDCSSIMNSVIKKVNKMSFTSLTKSSSSLIILDEKILNRKSSTPNTLIKGKLSEQDVSIIFYNLTGLKNFDNKEKIKNQFDRNKGYSQNLNECPTQINIHNYLDGKKVSQKSVVPMKLNFQLFLKSFELIACKLHIDFNLDEAVKFFIDFDLKEMIKDHTDSNYITVKSNLMEALSYLKKEEIMDTMNELNTILLPHFNNYADQFGLMTFDTFFEFYKDFSVFPNIINLVQLKSIFFTLSEVFKLNLKNDNISPSIAKKTFSKSIMSKTLNGSPSILKLKQVTINREAINFELFIDSLALAALHSKTHEDKNEIEKIVILADRMSQSKGILKSQLKSGTTFNSNFELNSAIKQIKSKFPNLFQKKKELPEMLRSPTCFDDIFD